MKRFFRMIIKDKEGKTHFSQWFNMESRGIFEITKNYEIATKQYQLVCNVEYKEEF